LTRALAGPEEDVASGEVPVDNPPLMEIAHDVRDVLEDAQEALEPTGHGEVDAPRDLGEVASHHQLGQHGEPARRVRRGHAEKLRRSGQGP
jgi:hypothetical protein